MDERLYQQEFENANRQQIEAEEKRMESVIRETEAQEAQMEQEIARTVEREVMAALKAEGIRIDREEASRTVQPPQIPETPVCEPTAPAITAADILGHIDTILVERDYIQQVIESINTMPVNDSPNGGFDGQARAQALEAIVKGREETNRKVLALLEKMYDDIVGHKQTSQASREERKALAQKMASNLTSNPEIGSVSQQQLSIMFDRIERLLD